MSMSNNFFYFLFCIQNYFDSHICTQIFIVMWEVRLFKSYLIRLHFPPWKCYSTHNMLYTLFAGCQQQYFSLSQNQHQLTAISQPAVLFSHSKSAPANSHNQPNWMEIFPQQYGKQQFCCLRAPTNESSYQLDQRRRIMRSTLTAYSKNWECHFSHFLVAQIAECGWQGSKLCKNSKWQLVPELEITLVTISNTSTQPKINSECMFYQTHAYAMMRAQTCSSWHD